MRKQALDTVWSVTELSNALRKDDTDRVLPEHDDGSAGHHMVCRRSAPRIIGLTSRKGRYARALLITCASNRGTGEHAHDRSRTVHEDPLHRRGRHHDIQPPRAGGERNHQGPLQDPLLRQDPHRGHAQAARRSHHHRRRRRHRRIMEPRGEHGPGHPVDPRQGPAAGPDRRSRHHGPGQHEGRRGRHGQGPRAHQPPDARGPRHRPLRQHGLRREGRRPGAQRGAGLPEEQGALRPVQVGPEEPEELPRRAPRQRDLPPGQPGVPVPPRARQGSGRR